MRKKSDQQGSRGAYVKPSTKKHQPVDIVKGSYGGSYSLYYTSLYYSLYYTSLYSSLYYYSLYYSCWVARAVYGVENPQWLVFRDWMLNQSPSWFRKLYLRHGESFAQFIDDKPFLKSVIRRWMDTRTEGRKFIGGNVWKVATTA